jgi:hypothetical protein
MSTKLDSDNGLNLQEIVDLQTEAFAASRHHAAEINRTSVAIESMDFALRRAVAAGLADDRQTFLVAAGRLASMPETAVPE